MTVTNYIWDVENDSYLMETDEADSTTAIYTNETVQYGNVVSQQRGADTSYYHFDAIGSTRELTDVTETITDTNLYDAWGINVDSSGTTENPFGFVGEQGYYSDADARQLYLRRRKYIPSLATFKSTDPLLQGAAVTLWPSTHNSYSYAVNDPVNSRDPSGLIHERVLDWCELCIYRNFLSGTIENAASLYPRVLVDTRVISHVPTLQQVQSNEFDVFLTGLSQLTLKGQVAQIAFTSGNATAMTLGTEIHSRDLLRGCGAVPNPPCCKNKELQREAAIDNIRDVALVAHELVHVVQQLNLGEDDFYTAYLAEWSQWLARGATNKRAYECISFEIEGHAMQDVLNTFFSDSKRLATFNEACCKDELVPDAHVNIVRAGYERRVEALTKNCNRQYPSK